MGLFLTAFTKGLDFIDVVLRLNRHHIRLNEQLGHLAGFGGAFGCQIQKSSTNSRRVESVGDIN